MNSSSPFTHPGPDRFSTQAFQTSRGRGASAAGMRYPFCLARAVLSLRGLVGGPGGRAGRAGRAAGLAGLAGLARTVWTV